jgi:hypothetical protein
MSAHGVETLHEYPPFFDSLEELRAWLYGGTEAAPRGYVDGFAIIHHSAALREHFAGHPIVIIKRDPLEVRASWGAWEGQVGEKAFAAVLARFHAFCAHAGPNVLKVRYGELESYEGVNRLVTHCTGRALKLLTWQLFHRLKIELHKGKCRPHRITMEAA